MSDPDCSTCRHSRPALTDDTVEPVLKCQRYPPTLFVFNEEINQAWPDAVDPCGEYGV